MMYIGSTVSKSAIQKTDGEPGKWKRVESGQSWRERGEKNDSRLRKSVQTSVRTARDPTDRYIPDKRTCILGITDRYGHRSPGFIVHDVT